MTFKPSATTEQIRKRDLEQRQGILRDSLHDLADEFGTDHVSSCSWRLLAQVLGVGLHDAHEQVFALSALGELYLCGCTNRDLVFALNREAALRRFGLEGA